MPMAKFFGIDMIAVRLGKRLGVFIQVHDKNKTFSVRNKVLPVLHFIQ